jgi:hypothetical protein
MVNSPSPEYFVACYRHEWRGDRAVARRAKTGWLRRNSALIPCFLQQGASSEIIPRSHLEMWGFLFSRLQFFSGYYVCNCIH